MPYEDYFTEHEDDRDANEKVLNKWINKLDHGFNVVQRKTVNSEGNLYNKKVCVYTSSGKGSNIRDAETGIYYPNKVGSKDEDLFFKVTVATGECNSKNNSNCLFFMSPRHYENYMYDTVSPHVMLVWQEKCNARMRELKYEKKYRPSRVIVVK